MRIHRFLLPALLAGAVLQPTGVQGAGYGIYEQGVAVLGMAGAGTASVHDPSAVFFNPAAMSWLSGAQIHAGGTALTTNTSFAGTNPYPGYGVTEQMRRQTFFPPTLYATRRYNDRWSMGVGINSPFGLGVDWQDPERFTGRYIVTRADLRAINGAVNWAYRVTPQLSLAAGGNILFAQVDLRRRVLVPSPGGGGGQVDVASVRLHSDYDPGYGWNAAVSYAPVPEWRLGAAYRGKIVVDTEGDAEFTQIPTGDPVFDAGVAATLPPDQGVSTVLRFPAIWSAGIAWLPAGTWTVEGAVVFTEWSLFRDLPLRFKQTPANDETIVEDYRDTFAFRFGAEHRLPAFTYRFGYYFEQAAAPAPSVTPLLPDAARNGATVGLGLPLDAGKRWQLDLYDLALFVDRRGTEGRERDGFDGEYKSFINAFGAGLTYRFQPPGEQ